MVDHHYVFTNHLETSRLGKPPKKGLCPKPWIGGGRGECFYLSWDQGSQPNSFSCSYIQIRVFRAEILVRNSYA